MATLASLIEAILGPCDLKATSYGRGYVLTDKAPAIAACMLRNALNPRLYRVEAYSKRVLVFINGGN